MCLLVADFENFFSVWQLAEDVFHALVVFQRFDGKETGGIFVADAFVLTNGFLDFLNALFDNRAMVDMDMAEDSLFVMMFFRYEILVPFLQFIHYFRSYMLLDILRHIVSTFVDFDDNVEEFVYTL